jgi:hypothetical protein
MTDTHENTHEDHPGQSLVTSDGEVVKRWAQDRGAVPATAPGTEHGDHLGVLEFDFPGYGGENLREVSWDEWLSTFAERDLEFVYQEHLKDGRASNFFQLRRRDGSGG